MKKTRQNWIRATLERELSPLHLEIVNDTPNHKNHLGQHDGLDNESHFKLVVVSETFSDMPRVNRQRLVYALLESEMKTGALHSVSMRLYSPDEW